MQHERHVVGRGIGALAPAVDAAGARPAVRNQLEALHCSLHPQVQNLVTGCLTSRLAATVTGDEDTRAEILKVETQLLAAVTRVQRRRATGHRSGQKRHGGSGTIRQHDGDAVVGPDTLGAHPVAEPGQRGAQPVVRQHRPVLGKDGRVARGAGVQQTPNGLSHGVGGVTRPLGCGC